jgi:hypothetical protein
MPKPRVIDERLVYTGWLPQANQLLREWGWKRKHRLRQAGRIRFGMLPSPLRVTTFAYVRVIRILGPKQKRLDRDNFALLTKPLIDAAVDCGYLVDDCEEWADITYTQDDTRREKGPAIELEISYRKRRSTHGEHRSH